MGFLALDKPLCLSVGDHIHSGTVVGRLEGARDITLGFVETIFLPKLITFSKQLRVDAVKIANFCHFINLMHRLTSVICLMLTIYPCVS